MSALLPRILTWTRSLPLSTFGNAASIATVIAIVLTVTRLMDVRGRAEFAKHTAFSSRVALAALHEPAGNLRSSITELVDHASGTRAQSADPLQKIITQAHSNLTECQDIVKEHIIKAGLRVSSCASLTAPHARWRCCSSNTTSARSQTTSAQSRSETDLTPTTTLQQSLF